MAFETMAANPNYQIDFETNTVVINTRNYSGSGVNRVFNATYELGRYYFELVKLNNVPDYDSNLTHDYTNLAWLIQNTTDFDTVVALVSAQGDNLNPQNYTLRDMGFHDHFIYDMLSQRYYLEDIILAQSERPKYI